MSKPYEISIWQKELDTTSNSYKYYRFLTIGTDQMEYQGLAIGPKLTSNTNGTHTLSFSMYYKFIDNISAEGKVYAEVWYTSKISMPFKYTEYVETGKVNVIYPTGGINKDPSCG